MHVAYKHNILYSKHYKRCSDLELFQPLKGYFPESLISWVDNFPRNIKQPQTRTIILKCFYLFYVVF
jgi:hypothetical protein